MRKRILAIIVAVSFIFSINSLAVGAFAEEQTNLDSQSGATTVTSNTLNTADSNDQNTSSTSNTASPATTTLDNQNSQTGTNSTNENTQNITSAEPEATQTTVINDNTQTDVGIDTGSNQIDHSTVVDEFNTGDIAGQITVIKDEGSVLAPGSQIEVKSSQSDNQVNEDDFNHMDAAFDVGDNSPVDPADSDQFFVLNDQDRLNLDLNTGENGFDHNDVITSATTGDIDFATNLVNLLNLMSPELLLNLKIYSILGDLRGDIIVEDSFLNEPPAVNALSASDADNSQTDTNITREANFDMNTGENSLAENTVSGNIKTGDAAGGYFQSAFSGLLNKANFFIVNVLGTWTGTNQLKGYNNVLVNVMPPSGQSSQLFSCTDSGSDSQITLDQSVSAKANTGRNTFERNTFVGDLTTGHINLMENVIDFQRLLFALKNRLNIRMVNILGNWFGNLKKKNTQTAKTCAQLNTCPVTPAKNNTSAGGPSEGERGGLPEESEQQLVLAPEEVFAAQSAALSSQSQQTQPLNPGNIEAGTNTSYFFLLLLLIPVILLRHIYKKLRMGLTKK